MKETPWELSGRIALTRVLGTGVRTSGNPRSPRAGEFFNLDHAHETRPPDRRLHRRGRAVCAADPPHLRQLVHTGCPEVIETIKWKAPSFVHEGKILCFTAAFKEHAAFGFWHQGMEKLIEQDRGPVESARGLMGRLTGLADLPNDKSLLRYIKAAIALNASAAPARPSTKARKSLPVPADLAAALKQNKKSAATWANFSPSAQREYVEWITEAKRPETRATRLTTAIAWMAEGKKRNWKYENC